MEPSRASKSDIFFQVLFVNLCSCHVIEKRQVTNRHREYDSNFVSDDEICVYIKKMRKTLIRRWMLVFSEVRFLFPAVTACSFPCHSVRESQGLLPLRWEHTGEAGGASPTDMVHKCQGKVLIHLEFWGVGGYWSWGGSCRPNPPVWSHRWWLRTGEVRLHTGKPVWWAAVLQSERDSRQPILPSVPPWLHRCRGDCSASLLGEEQVGWVQGRVENGACHLGTTCCCGSCHHHHAPRAVERAVVWFTYIQNHQQARQLLLIGSTIVSISNHSSCSRLNIL